VSMKVECHTSLMSISVSDDAPPSIIVDRKDSVDLRSDIRTLMAVPVAYSGWLVPVAGIGV
jgi:hypothetical protein